MWLESYAVCWPSTDSRPEASFREIVNDTRCTLAAMSTESELRDWRDGQTNAERRCAGILSISG